MQGFLVTNRPLDPFSTHKFTKEHRMIVMKPGKQETKEFATRTAQERAFQLLGPWGSDVHDQHRRRLQL